MDETRIGEFTLRYASSGSGPVALFLHGFPLDHSMWHAQRAALGDVRTCVAPDLRGFGASAAVTSPILTMEAHARDAVALLDAVGAEQADVVALSMGGYVALTMWALSPDRFRTLTLVDTRAEADDELARAKRDDAAQKLLEVGRERWAAEMLNALVGPQASLFARGRIRSMIERTSYETIVAALAGMKVRADRKGLLETITVPTLVVCGKHDAITPPPYSRRMAEAIPDARLELVDGAGHMSPVERPDAVNKALRSFWVGEAVAAPAEDEAEENAGG